MPPAVLPPIPWPLDIKRAREALAKLDAYFALICNRLTFEDEDVLRVGADTLRDALDEVERLRAVLASSPATAGRVEPGEPLARVEPGAAWNPPGVTRIAPPGEPGEQR